MLNVFGLTNQFPLMVIKHQGNCPGDFPIPFPFLLNRMVPNKVCDYFEKIGILPCFHNPVKCF